MGTSEINPISVDTHNYAELDTLRRQELADRAIDAVAQVLQVGVSVPNLLALTSDHDDTVRVNAKRVLRCISDIGSPDSEVMEAIGEKGIYHYAEAVVGYGASRGSFLGLMQVLELPPEGVTGLYEVRRLVAEQTDGTKPGFAKLVKALYSVGIDPHQAALDPEEAVDALDQAGYFVGYLGGVTFDRPIFAPDLAGKIQLGVDIDTVSGAEARIWVQSQFGGQASLKEDEEA